MSVLLHSLSAFNRILLNVPSGSNSAQGALLWIDRHKDKLQHAEYRMIADGLQKHQAKTLIDFFEAKFDGEDLKSPDLMDLCLAKNEIEQLKKKFKNKENEVANQKSLNLKLIQKLEKSEKENVELLEKLSKLQMNLAKRE